MFYGTDAAWEHVMRMRNIGTYNHIKFMIYFIWSTEKENKDFLCVCVLCRRIKLKSFKYRISLYGMNPMPTYMKTKYTTHRHRIANDKIQIQRKQSGEWAAHIEKQHHKLYTFLLINYNIYFILFYSKNIIIYYQMCCSSRSKPLYVEKLKSSTFYVTCYEQ